MDWAKTTARWDEKHLSLGIWCDLYLLHGGVKPLIGISSQIPWHQLQCNFRENAILYHIIMRFDIARPKNLNIFRKVPVEKFKEMNDPWICIRTSCIWYDRITSYRLTLKQLGHFFYKKQFSRVVHCKNNFPVSIGTNRTNILSAQWLLVAWCFSTRASVTTLLNTQPCVFSYSGVKVLDPSTSNQLTKGDSVFVAAHISLRYDIFKVGQGRWSAC